MVNINYNNPRILFEEGSLIQVLLWTKNILTNIKYSLIKKSILHRQKCMFRHESFLQRRLTEIILDHLMNKK